MQNFPALLDKTTSSGRDTQRDRAKEAKCFWQIDQEGMVPSVNPLPTFFNTKNETNFEEYSDDDEEAQVMEDIQYYVDANGRLIYQKPA